MNNSNLPESANNVCFDWSFEDCGNLVTRMCEIEVDGLIINEVFDGGMAVGDARRQAKAWAKSKGAVFLDITDASTAKDYRYAQMECNARNR